MIRFRSCRLGLVHIATFLFAKNTACFNVFDFVDPLIGTLDGGMVSEGLSD
jgi:hypothetical protein